jgi:hypothetical protein
MFGIGLGENDFATGVEVVFAVLNARAVRESAGKRTDSEGIAWRQFGNKVKIGLTSFT